MLAALKRTATFLLTTELDDQERITWEIEPGTLVSCALRVLPGIAADMACRHSTSTNGEVSLHPITPIFHGTPLRMRS